MVATKRNFIRRPGVALRRRLLLLPIGLICCGVVICLSLAGAAAAHWTHPQRIPPDITPAALGLEYEDVTLRTEDDLRIAAWYVPSENGATIIVVHGLGTNRTSVLGIAQNLAVRGYGVFLPELRAHGNSEGTVSSLGVREVRDIRASMRYLQSRPEVDQERIGIWGASLGGATALLAAGEIEEIRAVVVDSSFSSIEWVAEHQFEKIERLPGWLAPLVVALGSWQADVDARDVAPIRSVGAISPRPLLIIHGLADELFAVENAVLLAEAAGPTAELWILPGVSHTAAYLTDPTAYIDRVATFFKQSLPGDG
jgi:dipeptidyl aminopeptidase/acylaminoacyl peptidase